jgi:Tfp pilus assembly protein PilX
MSSRGRIFSAARYEHGFTMIVTIGVMFVTSLLLVAAFTIANGDIVQSRESTTQKQAYYAALAGLQQYEYKLQSNPDYWESCGHFEGTATGKNAEGKVYGEASEHYAVTPLIAESAPNGTKECSTESPFTTMIQSTGNYANTFRIKSVGEVKATSGHSSTRTLIATFGVTNFLDFVYYTNFETLDPKLYGSNEASTAAACEGKYYETWSKEKQSCQAIEFTNGDKVDGPMHTNDTALVGGSATFGRSGHEPKDVVEMYRGTYGAAAGCKSSATYYTATKCYVEKGQAGAEELLPPPNDTSLASYVEPENEYVGTVHLELKGSEIGVTYHNSKGETLSKTVKWPANGLLYVKNSEVSEAESHSCPYEYEATNADNSEEEKEETYCGNVYVSGNYEKPLTIAGADDIIVNGNIYPTGLKLASSGEAATKPTGTAVLGLIAGEYVRVYHPCSGSNGKASLNGPWIYAGILATQHSWIVDNYNCGEPLGDLNIYGAIGQDYRGIVGQGSNGKAVHGYIKNYQYDERLATDEPPYFLAPLKAGWKVIRMTAPSAG